MGYYNSKKRLILYPLLIGLWFLFAHSFFYLVLEWPSTLYSHFVQMAASKFAEGVFVAFLLEGWHRIAVRVRSGSWASSLTAVWQTREVLLRKPFELVFEECKHSLKPDWKWKYTNCDPENGRITAVLPPSILRWNRDVVDFEIEQLGSKLTKVRLTARPYGRTPVIDSGSNLKRAERIRAHLEGLDSSMEYSGRKINPLKTSTPDS